MLRNYTTLTTFLNKNLHVRYRREKMNKEKDEDDSYKQWDTDKISYMFSRIQIRNPIKHTYLWNGPFIRLRFGAISQSRGFPAFFVARADNPK